MIENFQNKKITGLRYAVEQVVRLEAHKASLVSDINDVYSQAKIQGLDVKALKKMIKLHMQQADDDAYLGQAQHYKQAFEAELRALFESDPERLKREYFHMWIQWANK